MSEPTSHQRWYDQDPALSRALGSLQQAHDRYQAQIALNIIKIIIEHRIEDATQGQVSSDDVQQLLESSQSPDDHHLRRRWYDVNETLRSALHLLRDTPDDIQAHVIPTISKMIEQALAKEEI